MAKPRKTLYVEDIKRIMNNLIEKSALNRPKDKDFRRGVAWALEKILLDTNNYYGFKCLAGPDGKEDLTYRKYF